MYTNNEENNLRKNSVSVLERETVQNAQTQSRTSTEPAKFTEVTKNKSRLTVTNAGVQSIANTNEVEKTKAKSKTRNMAMMVVYSIAAVALACVVALNAITLSTVSASNNLLSAELSTLETTYQALSSDLSVISSTERVTELASSQLGLTETSATVASFSVPGYVTLSETTFENNWFDNLLDKIGS